MLEDAQDIARAARRRDTETTMTRGGGTDLGDDKGLDFIIPLLMFLHKTCHKAVCCFLMKHFGTTDYVNKKINTHEGKSMTLKIFLEQVNEDGKKMKAKNEMRGGKPKNINKKGNPTQQQQQPSAESMKRRDDIQNITENEEILNSVAVGALMLEDEACQKELEKLDICFVLNIILNSVINIPLYGLEKFFFEFKGVRKVLVHPKFYFTEKDFDNNLKKLMAAAEELYKHLSLNEQELQKSEKDCRQDAATGNKALLIQHNLVKEAHEKYIPPDSTFVPPDITLLKTSGKEVLIQDLNKFIEGQQDQKNVIVLSGEHREEKARLLEGLASTFKGHKRFKLVVHVNERDRKHSHWLLAGTEATGEHFAATFQDQVFDCLAHLAPRTVHQYGLDAVKAAISAFQKDILFLVNWNNLGHVSSELQKGTWVLTYEGKEPPLADWQVLRLELYTEAQVLEMINYHTHKESNEIRESKSKEKLRDVMMGCYNRLDNKNILSSLDMIQIFLEVCTRESVESDFELVKIHVENSLKGFEGDKQAKEDIMVRLGKDAYTSIYKPGFISKDNIPQFVLESFLYPVEGKGWSFKHSSTRDFMAAKYVVANQIEAQREWVNENVVSFKRVFKFACFLWCRSDSKEREYLPHMEAFLKIFLSAPKKGEKTQGSPFDSWDLLFDLDDACVGSRKVLKPLMSILSDIPCWCFNAAQCQGLDKRLTRMDKILRGKELTLKKDNPLIIKLKSTNTNMKLITEFWKKLRQIPAMYDCVRIEMTVEGEDTSHRNEIEDFFKTVADTDVPLYITRYKGPLFPSIMSKCLKCECMQNLEILEVCVNDVSSLKEVLSCGVKEMHIMINIESPEESNFTPSSIVFPSVGSVHMSIKYFHNIQQLLDGLQGCHHLCSLSIHDLYIMSNFKLNLSAFSQLESLNIRFEPDTVDVRPLAPEEERMEGVEEGGEGNGHRLLPRSNWLSHLLPHLTLPENLKRLLLRNADFFRDSNQNLINELSEKYSIKRVVNLDSSVSFIGAGQTHCSQTGDDDEEEEENHKERKRLQMTEFPVMGESSTKRPKRNDAMNSNEPNGMEVV